MRALSNGKIELGNLATAQFLRTVAWTIFIFAEWTATTGDEGSLWSKWGAGGTRQWNLVSLNKAAPSNIEIQMNGVAKFTGGANIALDTKYLIVVGCEGDSSANDIHLNVLNMAGTFLDDDVTGTGAGPVSNLTEPVRLGAKGGSGDELQGSLGYAAYIDAFISSKNEMLAYLGNPIRVAKIMEARNSAELIMPLWGRHSPEIDLSVNGVSGTLTNATAANDPPVTLFTPKWAASTPLIEVGAPPAGFVHSQAVLIN